MRIVAGTSDNAGEVGERIQSGCNPSYTLPISISVKFVGSMLVSIQEELLDHSTQVIQLAFINGSSPCIIGKLICKVTMKARNPDDVNKAAGVTAYTITNLVLDGVDMPKVTEVISITIN